MIGIGIVEFVLANGDERGLNMDLFNRQRLLAEQQANVLLRRKIEQLKKELELSKTVSSAKDGILEAESIRFDKKSKDKDSDLMKVKKDLAKLKLEKRKLVEQNMQLLINVKELTEKYENERYRADRYADVVRDSMQYGWESVPEEEMEKAGFKRTETGWKVSE